MNHRTGQSSYHPDEENTLARLRASSGASMESSQSWSSPATDKLGGGSFSRSSTSSPVPPAPNLLFVTANEPQQFKDPSVMKRNRAHVMNNHLLQRQRSRSAESRDSRTPKRIPGSPRGVSKKAASSGALPSTLSDTALSSVIPLEPYLTPRGSPLFLSESYFETRETAVSTSSQPREQALSIYQHALDDISPTTQLQDSRSFTAWSSDALGVYQSCEDITPFPDLTATEPFLSPTASTQDFLAHDEKLTLHYDQYFGCRPNGLPWNPQHYKDQRAFLSPLCISSSNQDVMSGQDCDSPETTRVKSDMVRSLRQSMSDFSRGTSDPTIMTIVHLLYSELIGGDETILSVHERGIRQILELKGGLDRLGGDGALAAIATTVAFHVSILRERQPYEFFVDYFANLPRPSPTLSRPVPESPLYCPLPDLPFLRKSHLCSRQTLDILITVRDLTDVFLNSQQLSTNTFHQTLHDQFSIISNLHTKLLAFPSARDYGSIVYNDWIYESCRLAAIIFSSAILQKVPLSRVSSILPSRLSRSPPRGLDQTADSITAQLEVALRKTDTSGCWDEFAGVLLWATLVGGAAARGRKERRWIVAVGVRCALMLGFQYRYEVLGTMRRLLRVMENLKPPEGGEWFAQRPMSSVARERMVG